MLPPLEYSMSLWWFATPLWESEESVLDMATSFVVDTLAAADPDPMPPAEVNEGVAWAGISDLVAPVMGPLSASLATLTVAKPSAAAAPAGAALAPARRVLKGYTWSAQPAWVPHLGPLWQGFVDVRRHDTLRHREQRLLLDGADQVRSEPARCAAPLTSKP
jgi:hypothetical protein